MSTLPFRTADERAAAMPHIVAHLRADGLLAYPTETVYGFGGAVTHPAAAKLRALKQRDVASPFLLLLHDAAQAPAVQWNDAARTLARAFWPGPLTLALPAADDTLPEGIVSLHGLVALRVTPHEGARALLEGFGAPLTSTSANTPGAAPATSAAEVLHALDVLRARDVLVLDGGSLPPSAPSTLVACEPRRVRLLRAGAIRPEAIRVRLQGSGIDVE